MVWQPLGKNPLQLLVCHKWTWSFQDDVYPAVREGVNQLFERAKHTAVQWLQLVGTVRGVGEENNARFLTKVNSSQRHVGVMIVKDQQDLM